MPRPACARLLGLNATQTWHALGIAASQSSGLVENLPNAAKNVGVGNAARNGLFAALLAEQGLEAAPAAIEGPFGWAHATGDEPRRADLFEGLGTQWEFLKNTYKPYPCGIVMHAVIDACLELQRDHGLRPEQIARVTVRGDQLLLDRGDRIVTSDRSAKVSIHHCAAAALLFGRADLEEFAENIVMRPDLVAFRACIRAELDAALPTGAAAVSVETIDGRTLTATVLHARGSLEQPLTDREIDDKVRKLAKFGDWPHDIDVLITAAWGMEEATDLRALMAATRAPIK